jgi:hypothetical protein
MHSMNPGCDFRVIKPKNMIPRSTEIDTRLFIEHPSR